MNEKEKNKRYFKRLLPLFILFVVCFGALGWSFMAKGTKVKAGVLFEEMPVLIYSGNLIEESEPAQYEELWAETNVNLLYSGSVKRINIDLLNQDNSVYKSTIGSLSIWAVNQEFSQYYFNMYVGSNGTGGSLSNHDFKIFNNIVYLEIGGIFEEMRALGNNSTLWENYKIRLRTQSGVNELLSNNYCLIEHTISNVNNIYDLEENDLCLLYLSDISELSTSEIREEITINWGYIDENDNTLYAEYAPTIGAQNMQADNDTIIRLGIPINNNGSASEYVDISQKALLSTISADNGGATATAHIYGVYIWRSYNMIEWGLAEFDTTSIPASGASMNYLTGTTRKYQYQNLDTITMTCRISVSSNFNFITIKNQNMVDVATINQTIRQGGFLPAWAVYNWARGSASGFNAGEDYANAQYQEGQAGYNTIYQAGYYDGLNANIGTQNWFVSAFSAVDALLNIRILPNITIGTIIGIPFVISLVWFIIRTFRGGGGD